MMDEMDILLNDCLNKARRVNEIVNKIKGKNSRPSG
jgi:hypothetical protein